MGTLTCQPLVGSTGNVIVKSWLQPASFRDVGARSLMSHVARSSDSKVGLCFPRPLSSGGRRLVQAPLQGNAKHLLKGKAAVRKSAAWCISRGLSRVRGCVFGDAAYGKPQERAVSNVAADGASLKDGSMFQGVVNPKNGMKDPELDSAPRFRTDGPHEEACTCSSDSNSGHLSSEAEMRRNTALESERASTSGRGEVPLPTGRVELSRKGSRRDGPRAETSYQLRQDAGPMQHSDRARAQALIEAVDGGKDREKLGERGANSLGGRSRIDRSIGQDSTGVPGNGPTATSSRSLAGRRDEASLPASRNHAVEGSILSVADSPLGKRSTDNSPGQSRGVSGLLATLKTLSPLPPKPSPPPSQTLDDANPQAWRRPLSLTNPPETPEQTPAWRKQQKWSRELNPALVRQAVEELKKEPQWGNIAGILDKWEGRTSLRNYELLLKELCWQGDYLRSIKAFAWMKEQRKWYKPRVEIYNHVLKMLARYGKLNFVRSLFKEMDLYSVTPNTDSWQALIAAHGKAGSSEGAVWAFEEMQRRRVPANNRSYNSLMSAFAHGGQWKLALEYLDKMQEDGISPDLVTFNTVITACRNGGEFERAIDIFESLPSLGIRPNRVTCNTMITVYSRIGHFEKVTALFQEMQDARGGSQQRPDLLTYNSVLQAYSVSGDLEKSGALFDRMLQHGPKPSLVTWNTLMSAYAKLGRHSEARALLLRLKENGKQPDVVSYSTLLSAYAKAGLSDEARGVFEEMTNEGVTPNFVTYNSVMDAYAKSNDYEGALAWLKKMQKDGVAPNVVTYTTLINACGRAGRLEEAARILDEAGESVNVVSAEPSDHNPCANRVEVQGQGARAGAGSNVNVVTYNAMIHSCGANDAFDAAVRVFNLMRAAGVQPNAATYNGVIDSLGRAGKVDEMEAHYQQMLREGVVPTVETFTIMIDVYGKKGLPEEAWRTFEAMKAAGCPPNIVTLTALIDACAKGNVYYEGMLAWQELLALGLEPDVVTYGALIEMCNKNGNFDVALEFGEKMRRQARHSGGLKPNHVIYNQLLVAAGRQRDLDLCIELFQEMQDMGNVPNNWTFHTLMEAFGTAGRPEKVERIFREMQNLFGVEANLVSYNLVIGAYARAVNGRALEIFKELNERRIIPSVMTYNWVLMYMRKAGLSPNKAIRLFSEMVATGTAPTAISYTEMVRILERAGMDKEARAMQKELEILQGDESILRIAEPNDSDEGLDGEQDLNSWGSSGLDVEESLDEERSLEGAESMESGDGLRTLAAVADRASLRT